jgi:dipeptidase E
VKLLLTSVGLSNDSIKHALVDLLGKPLGDCTAVHVPTAVYAMAGGAGYAAEMSRYWDDLGWRKLAVVELTALPSLPDEYWLPELQAADAVLVAGGNSGYLSYWFHESGFADRLSTLGRDTVYVGVSAGSCVLTPALNYDPRHLARTGVFYDDEYDEAAPAGAGAARGLGLVDFYLRPHLNSEDFGVDLGHESMARAAAKVRGPLYAIDDNTALTVVDGVVDVVSEGQWRLFNAPGPSTPDQLESRRPTGDTDTTARGQVR